MSIGTDDIKLEKNQSYKFEEYLCFYCDTIIRHKRSCRETVIALVDSYTCDKCGENCMNEDAFNEHKTWYHAHGHHLGWRSSGATYASWTMAHKKAYRHTGETDKKPMLLGSEVD